MSAHDPMGSGGGAPPPDLNEAELHRRLKGKRGRLTRLSGAFFQHYLEQLGAISQAITKGQPELLRQAAHAYKGTVASFSADASTRLAQQLEELGRSGQIEPAGPIFEELRQLAEVLRVRLEQLPQQPEWSQP